jgi:hypothetical protein
VHQQDSVDDLAIRVEEEVRKVLEKFLGRRASSFFIMVKLDHSSGKLDEAAVEVEVHRGVPGVDVEAVIEEALEAARNVIREYIRSRRGGGR